MRVRRNSCALALCFLSLSLGPALAQGTGSQRAQRSADGDDGQPESPTPPPAPDVAPASESPPAPAQPVIVPPRALAVPKAVYPVEAFEAGVQADVMLLIDIDVEGAVSRVEVKVPVGQGFDEAAVAAVQTMRFSPATVDGVLTPVRISYTYRFTIEKKEVAAPPPPPLRTVIEGEVVERGTRKRLAGVPVLVQETGETFFSDAKGGYTIEARGGGTYTLTVTVQTHLDYEKVVSFDGDEVANARLKLTRDRYADYRTTIKREKIDTEVAKKKLTATEIQKIPGNSGDAIKVIQTLPGVARGTFGGSRPIVRGSNPRDTRVYLEGVELDQLFHFGGLYSVMNTDLLEAVDFWPGGYSAAYGKALGGLVELRLRPLKTDRWHGIWETNIFHSGFLVEGPVGKNGALAFAARRSYIDVVLESVLPDDLLQNLVAPRYYDYQIRYTHDFSQSSRIDAMILGADDLFKLYLEEKEGPEGQFFGTLATLFDFHYGIVRWEWEPEKDKRVRVTSRVGYNGFDIGLGDVFGLDVDNYVADIRAEFIWDVRDDLVVRSGLETNFQPYIFTGKVPPVPPKEGEQGTPPDLDDFITFTEKGDRTILSPYVDLAWQVTDTWTLNPGLRLESYQNSSGFSYFGPEPRFATRWDVSETTTLKGQVGHHRQPPFEEQQSVSVGNPGLEAQKSWQYALGIDQQIGESVLADVQVFYKDMWGLVVSPDPLEDTVDVSVSDGVGRVYGLEAIIRHDPTEMFFGWISYTLMRAERRDRPSEAWRPFDYDQTHILTAVGVFQLGSGWEAGFRFRHTTGNPYDPITGGIYNVDTDFFLPVYGAPNSGRLPDFQQLDLRVDKKWIYDDWMLNLYLEVQNVYLHENVEGSSYSYDFSDRIPVTGIPIVPNFGLRADF